MNLPSKKYFLPFFFIVFSVSFFILLFPKSSLADDGPHISDTHTTACGEVVTIGYHYRKECCHYDSCCTGSEEDGTCDSDSCCTHTHCTQYHCSGSWDEYKATTNGCGGLVILHRKCKSLYPENDGSNDCCGHPKHCEIRCGIWEGNTLVSASEDCENCQEWQKAIRSGDSCSDNEDAEKWCKPKHECKCCPDCLEAPTNHKYYLTPSGPPEADPNNVLLPVKLDWDDVPGWIGGYGGSFLMSCSSGSKVCSDSSDTARNDWTAYHECESACIDACERQAEEDWNATHEKPIACQGLLNILSGPCREKCSPYLSGAASVCAPYQPGYTAEVSPEECTATCPAVEGDEVCYPPSAFVQYYQIEINGPLRDCAALIDIYNGETPETSLNINKYTAFLGVADGGSEFIPPCSCFFKSGESYTWRVRACCDNTESKCAPWSKSETWSFKTSLAPEPAWPYDTNWIAPGGARVAYAPVIDWCDVEKNITSYLLEVYKKDGDIFNLVLPERTMVPNSLYDDDAGWQELKTGTHYGWQVTACPTIDTPKEKCSQFSQFWEFSFTEELATSTDFSPPDGGAVNLSTILSWVGDRYAAGYLLSIQGGGINKEFQVIRVSRFPLKNIWEDWLKLDTPYTWKVAACKGSETDLECEDPATGQIQWTDPMTFITTGAPPTNIRFEPVNENGEVGVPLTALWDAMPGAASYFVEVPDIGFSRAIKDPKITFTFSPPYFEQGKTYTISVKTCADETGETCGIAAGSHFTIAPLEPPAIIKPAGGGDEYISNIGAQSEEVFGAHGYEWKLVYQAAGPDETAACNAKVGLEATSVSATVSNTLFAYCSGQYSLQARGCIESSCAINEGLGQWGAPTTFNVNNKEGGAGLVPCGQSSPGDNPNWDAREQCQIKHAFLLIKIILDFLLLRVLPIILVLLAVYSGVIIYFGLPMGILAPMQNVRSLWKAAGIGIGIILFAWLFINLLLHIVGYPIGVLGNWYQISP